MTAARAGRVLGVLALGALGGCDLFGPGGPGTLEATVSAQVPLGAVVLEVTGVGITGFEDRGDTQAYGASVVEAEGRHRVVLIDQGHVVAEGTPEEFVRSDHPRIRSFLARPHD